MLAFAADIVLIVHALFVLFVVLGLVLILVGGVRHWNWVRNRRFRWVHLLAIGVVVVQAWFGVICPLTTLEMWLRSRGGGEPYAGTFSAHWLQALLYYEAPAWLFAVTYTAFGALVAASWFWVRPGRPNGRSDNRIA